MPMTLWRIAVRSSITYYTKQQLPRAFGSPRCYYFSTSKIMSDPVTAAVESNESPAGDEEGAKNNNKRKIPLESNLEKKKKTKAQGWVDKKNTGTRRKTDDVPRSERNSVPNEGSYADPAMQELYSVELPETPPLDGVRRSKKKVAMLMSYLGSRYAGFQINKGQKTLQAELELAIYKAGLLQKSNFGYPHKYGWSTSGRTDKGVHACAQVCSAKIEMGGDAEEDDVRERINAHLPADISLLDLRRVTKGFCAKTMRSRVRYQYMIPSYLFFPNVTQLYDDLGIKSRGKDPLTTDEVVLLRSKLKDYRITPEQLAMLKSALSQYKGTLPYHNYTKGMQPGDKTANRYILDFEVADVVLHDDDDGTEWIHTRVLGQSFLLNQIRKMIAVATDVVRNQLSLDTMKRFTFCKTRKMNLPIAPAQGLFMDMSVYEQYNDRIEGHEDVSALDWINEPDSPAMKRWKTFKDDVVLKKIVEEEALEGNFLKFLYMQTHVYDLEGHYKLDDDDDDAKDESKE